MVFLIPYQASVSYLMQGLQLATSNQHKKVNGESFLVPLLLHTVKNDIVKTHLPGIGGEQEQLNFGSYVTTT